MNDLISRQAAIKKLMECGDFYEGNDEAKRGVSQCMGIIYDIPPAKRWIPVTESLPEEDGSYLVFGKCAPDEDYHCFISDFDTGCEAFGEWEDRYNPVTFGYVDSVFYGQDYVLAWMPLPEPFKEG